MKKMTPQKNEIKKYFFAISFILLLMSCDAKREANPFKNDQFSILPVTETGYGYKNLNILKIGVTTPLIYSNFLNSGFFAICEKKIYNIYIFKDCIEDFKIGNYTVYLNNKTVDTLHSSLCDIYFREYFRTNLKIGDSLNYSALGLDRVMLQTKFYDEAVKDSIYIFEKMTNGKISTGFAFTYSHGFIGLYSVYHKIDNIVVKNNPVIAIRDAYGKIYEDSLKRIYPEAGITYIDSIHPEFINLDLSVIKEFTKN